MAEADQAMRARGSLDPEVDARHRKRMKEIVAEIGWPTISKVGPEPSHKAWLLVQHASAEPEFQEYCLSLMHAVSGDVDKKDIAYLEDRTRAQRGLPQLYGTQFLENDGVMAPRDFDDIRLSKNVGRQLECLIASAQTMKSW